MKKTCMPYCFNRVQQVRKRMPVWRKMLGFGKKKIQNLAVYTMSLENDTHHY